jgi:hypothetical protein
VDIILLLFTWIIGLVVLYYVIRSAIDNSEAAGYLREIRNMLREMQHPPAKEKGPREDIINDITYHQYPDDQCPSCGRKVASTDKTCPSCGLTLIDEVQ